MFNTNNNGYKHTEHKSPTWNMHKNFSVHHDSHTDNARAAFLIAQAFSKKVFCGIWFRSGDDGTRLKLRHKEWRVRNEHSRDAAEYRVFECKDSPWRHFQTIPKHRKISLMSCLRSRYREREPSRGVEKETKEQNRATCSGFFLCRSCLSFYAHCNLRRTIDYLSKLRNCILSRNPDVMEKVKRLTETSAQADFS